MRKLSKILALVLVLMTVFSVITAITASAKAGETWTVAGVKALCGTDWNPGDKNNDMTYDAATDSYVKVYTNVKAGSYQFKCAKNHAWGTAYPGSNYNLKVEKDGSTVTITLKGKKVTATVVAPSCDHAYEVTAATVTCLTGGSRTWTCSKCQDSYTENLDALGHYYDESGKCIRCDATAELVRVYVENAAKWANVYCYTWDTNPYVAWPGEQMKLDSESGLYYYDIPKHFVNVIFNNGDDTQSADLKTPTGTATIYNNSTKKWTAPHVCSFVDGKCTCGEFDPAWTVVGTLEELNAALVNGGNIILNGDITSSEIIVVGFPAVINGNGHTITSTAGRAINISGADGVTIKNLTVVANGERGFNVIQNATNVVLDNVTAKARNYTINVAGSAANAVVTVKNSDLTGLNTVNIAGAGAQIAISDTKITCDDQTDIENYGAITVGPNCPGVTLVGTGVEFDVKGDSVKVANASQANITFTDAEVDVTNQVAMIVYGDYAYTYRTLEDAIAAAKPGETVYVFAGTYAVPSMKAGITIEGVGEVLFEGTLSGTLENLTLKNIHIKGGNAQRWAYAKGDLVFENVTFEATSVYALHFDGITEGATLLYKDCTIIGWAAMSGSPESCVFDGCTIKGNGSYGVIRTYFDATIKDCTFDVANVNPDDAYQDGIHSVGATVTVNNCTNANGEMNDIINISTAGYVVLDGETIHVHSYTAGETVAPTFNAEGYTVYTCTCGKTENRDIVAKLEVTFPEAVVTPVENPELTFALNFGIKDLDNFTEDYVEALLNKYGHMYVDYRLTIEGLVDTEVVFNANGNADGFLGGQYDAWSTNWVYVPFEDVTVANGESILIMELAAKLMGQSGLRYTLAEVATIVVDFDCGVFFTEEFLLANPNMKVTLDLIVFEEDAEGNKTLLNGAPVATNVFYGHEHTYETVVTAPTCDDAGYTTYTCACGHTYTGDEVAALGHDLVDVEALAATCTTAGYTAHKDCSRCDYVEGKEVIDALGHKDTRLDAKCDVCGQYFVPTSPFKLEMYQHSKKATYYFKGSMSGYYFATTSANSLTGAVDVYAEETDGGYYLYFMSGTTKNYLYIQLSGTHINAKYGSTKAVWTLDPTYGTFVTVLNGSKYFYGTYGTYVTMGGTAYSRLSASTVDVSQFVARPVSLADHVCVEFTSKVTAPTCTAQGYTTKTCVDCGAVTKVDYVDALGHDLVDVEAKAPTCTEAGYTAHKDCSRCTYVEGKETVAALGHTEVVDKAVAPTCTETGLTEGSHCSVCEAVIVAQNEVPALGHTEVIDDAVAPTCTETGLTEGKHCSVCEAVIVAQEEVPALGHTEVIDEAVAPTCTETGLTEGKHCSVCEEVLVAQKEVPALGHTFGEVTVTTEPTCTVAGEGTHTCSVCGVTETVEVAALGHVEVLDKEVAPTCTEAGLTKGSHCSVCNEVLAEQKEVPALGHTFVDGECECGAKDPSIVPPVVEPEVEEEEDLNAFEKIWAFILSILNWVVDFFKGAFVKA